MRNEKQLFRRGSDILQIETKYCTGGKIDKFRTTIDNPEEVARIFQLISDKYGLGLHIVIKEKVVSFWDSDVSMKWP